MKRFYKYRCCYALLACTSLPAYGRFHHQDQVEIDKQEKPGVEYYNDIDSYRYPIRWDQTFKKADHGFRTSAGSLNQTKFAFHEQWKSISRYSEHSYLQVKRTKNENYTDLDESMEVRWTQTLLPMFSWSIAGEGEFYKKWGDIGLGIKIHPHNNLTLSFEGWSVDHFYNTKNSEHSDIYSKKPISLSSKIVYQTPQDTVIALRGTWDRPLYWQRTSQDLDYHHEEKQVAFAASFSGSPDLLWNFKANQILKDEGKSYYNLARKDLSSKKQDVEIEFLYSASKERHWRVGSNFRKEDHLYQQFGIPTQSETESSTLEIESPQVLRKELAIYTSYEQLFSSLWFSSGLWIHSPEIQHSYENEDVHFHTTEVKLELAWDFIVSEGSNLRLNTTWDLDQMLHDFKQKNHIKPWGGGNIQVSITQKK